MDTQKISYFRVGIILLLILLGGTIPEADAKSNEAPAVPLVQSASSFSLRPFEKARFGIGFKNTSKNAWRASDAQKITLHAQGKNESYFYDSSWKSGTTVMSLPQDTQNGEIVYFWFTLEAPKTTGNYIEEFTLYRGNEKITSSRVRLPIVVAGTPIQRASALIETPPVPPTAAPAAVVQQQLSTPVARLTTTKLIQSSPSLIMKQYERQRFTIGFKNTSGVSWKQSQTPTITLRSKAAKESYFYDSSWIGGVTIMRLPQDVNDGEIAYFEFTLFAPIFPRQFQENLALYFGDTKISGSDVTIPITVMPASSSVLTQAPPQESSGATLIETTVPQQSDQSPQPQPSLVPQADTPRPGIIDDKTEAEPFIRVGLFYTTDPIRITAHKDYEIRDADGALIAQQSAGTITAIVFDVTQKTYTITTPTLTTTTQKYVRFRGAQLLYRTLTKTDGTIAVEPIADQDTIFEIPSYSNRPTWSSVINDNVFRGELEVRYAQATNRLWVVNELLFEQYLKGIAETSNSSPHEYQKALIIAARTYAKYHIDRNTKNASEGFTVKPTEADQVYRGYGAEKRMPNVSAAVEETRGVIVYYGDMLAITPYFSQSDGRTRSWEEVWGGGPKPWLVGKPDPMGEADCSTPEKKRFCGHYVGMSARGALAMALDNKGFEEILKYYYTNIELRKKY